MYSVRLGSGDKIEGNVDGMKVAVLACLELTDRLREMEGELLSLKARVDNKSREFSILLDDVLK